MTSPFYKVQHDDEGRLRHFLTTEGMSGEEIHGILKTAESFVNFGQRTIKKVPMLRGLTAINLFFEPSTRTRTTFEIAAKRLSADVINLESTRMSTSKGESLLDTVDTLLAMNVDLLIIRDTASGASMLVAEHIGEKASVINAGDGRHAHPTQAMLDAFTIKQYKGDFVPLSICIVGDILHSRVARSLIHTLNALGTRDIRVIGPRTLIPEQIERMGVSVFHDFNEGIEGVDVCIMLRQQRERMEGQLIPSEQEYFKNFGLTAQRLKKAKKDCIVMHPGPMNRGLEIASSVADGTQSVILDQVTNGIAVRMAAMATILGGRA